MSVKINWEYSDYSDVESVVICRSKVHNNEKAFEDSLNGLSGLNTQPTILTTINTSSLTGGPQSYTDILTLDPSTTYYYCVAAKGTGSNGLYKVGPSETEASNTPVTNSGDGNSSVASFTTSDGSGDADLFSVVGIKYINFAGAEVAKTELSSDQTEIDQMLTDFEDALNWLSGFISLPTGAVSHQITLNLCEDFPLDGSTLGSMGSTNLYNTSGAQSTPFPFGSTFTRDGNMKLNVPLLIQKAHEKMVEGQHEMDPLDNMYYFQVIVHELLHTLGFNISILDLTNTTTSGCPIYPSGEGEGGWLYRGSRATKEYRRYVQIYEDVEAEAVADILGIPLENQDATGNYVQAHWEEDKRQLPADGGASYIVTAGETRIINGRNYYAPAYSVISTRHTTLAMRWEDEINNTGILYYSSAQFTTRLELAVLEDIGYIINWAHFETSVGDINPIDGVTVDVNTYPYPT